MMLSSSRFNHLQFSLKNDTHSLELNKTDYEISTKPPTRSSVTSFSVKSSGKNRFSQPLMATTTENSLLRNRNRRLAQPRIIRVRASSTVASSNATETGVEYDYERKQFSALTLSYPKSLQRLV